MLLMVNYFSSNFVEQLILSNQSPFFQSLLLEYYYNDICTYVDVVIQEEACSTYFSYQKIDWTSKNLTDFQNLITRYTKENIAVVKVYLKEPFAHRLMIVEDITW